MEISEREIWARHMGAINRAPTPGRDKSGPYVKYWIYDNMSDMIAEAQYEKVQGISDGDIGVWKGIPFAQPPLGVLRFHAPQKPLPWTGVRDASTFGSIAAQPNVAMGFFASTPELSSEDCLFLNIWSPGADDRRRPVLFWIHGGAFVAGSGSTGWYDGTAFAANGDVVVVTINYRLGALGFLHLADMEGVDEGFSSNCGLLDQIAAFLLSMRLSEGCPSGCIVSTGLRQSLVDN